MEIGEFCDLAARPWRARRGAIAAFRAPFERTRMTALGCHDAIEETDPHPPIDNAFWPAGAQP
jgi:hypothetical protein